MTDVEIRKPVALRTLPGIEMAAVGTWHASTGVATFTTEDFTDAVAALQCPGVRNPVIKLGHSEEDSTSGVRWDGEPALGWVANMRFDGTKLIGDFTGLPAWLADADENGLSVMAAAYPDRSIEIYRPFLCQIGHLHPSAVTAISLLGVAPPAVGVLKSMQDVYALWTEPATADAVQAAAEQMADATRMQYQRPIQVSVHLAAEPERRALTDIEVRSGADFDRSEEQWGEALDSLMDIWPDISERQRDELAAQVADAVDNAPDTLGDMKADSDDTEAVLLAAMLVVARQAAADQVAEAEHQGVTIATPDVDEDLVRDTAEAVAAAMAASLAVAAGRTAAQWLGQGDGAAISAQVSTHLAGLSDAFPRSQFGGALSAAQAKGRLVVLEAYSGSADYYASEANDRATCAPCRSIDTKRFDSLDAALAAYGSGKYQGCAGGARCRGRLITIFGSDRASVATTVRMTLGGPMGTNGVVKASVSVEDISRKYYESAGYSMWIAELQVDPLQLITADDATGKHYRVPVELNGEEFVFGEPQEVAIQYADVKTAATAPVQFAERKLALLAAGKNEDGTDRVAKDVSPAGAAIRKAAEKTAAIVPAVLETEVATPVTEQTPDADPAAGPITTPKEAPVDGVKMREALGLGPDAKDDEVRKALAAQFSAPESAPNDTDPLAVLTAKLPAGERPILVDPENYRSLVAMAAKGETAYARVVKTEGKEFLEKSAKEGRFPVARLSVYQEMWDKNPEETRAYIELMPKNTVPTLATGLLGAEISQNESDLAYEGLYGKAAV